MQQTSKFFPSARKRRALALLLALALVLGLFPGVPGVESGAEAHWADPYLSQLTEWGFIRADQAENPDMALTRADFMAIVNRAYGYHELGPTPFTDVSDTAWYYDDVGIAYTAKYIQGTSPTTASPEDTLDRETSATILGRNMMLQESPGEILDFTDAHQISNWAKGTIKASLEHYLVSGYDDGTFRPQRALTWGEMASMLTSIVGTPLQEPGDYSLGGVYGNVTVTSPNVTLRDTVISGDLYITGGVGLGGIKLENVTVLGRIIASGTGQSEGGEASILLRNVTADELLVDNLQGNYVSLKADGVTDIGKTTVRTSAYIEDNTPDGMGLKYISLEGDSYPEGEEPEDWQPIQLDLAGRIGEVVNRTPRSQVRAASGTVAKLTVDETAVDSTVVIDRNTVVKELNLDTATIVTGKGDIEHLTVNAPGCEVEMLPDQIDIRPGITAIIAGEEMDSVGALESSEQPIILAGYPQAQDIVPTGLDAAFMTNKAGTVYWAVSAITDGSIGEEDLIKPPSYGNVAVRNGSVKVAQGNEETISKVTGLTPGGSYYLSAILVDARGQRSTVKVISFTTPDNTVPEFCAGYPKMSSIGTGRNPNPDDTANPGVSQVVVMPNKDCKLYYALLPQGAAAPTEDELKSNAVSGALGYGVRDVYKNQEDIFRVHDQTLEEQKTYVLYLWLTDADGANKGKITSLTFTTADETPPEFIVAPYVTKTQATGVTLSFRLNENGTVYWVAVPAGTRYPLPQPGTTDATAPLTSDYAILQVVSGMNIGADGKSGSVTAKENADGTITVSGLLAETAYDFYYVAKDNAGADRNYSITVGKLTISPRDEKPPVFTQSFTSTADPTVDTKDPLADTGIYIKISENVQYIGDNGQGSGQGFVEMYKEITDSTGEARIQAINRLAAELYNSIRLKQYSIQQGNEEMTTDDDYRYSTTQTFEDSMVLDYTLAQILDKRTQGEGVWVYFPSESLHLDAGGRYCFQITGLYDIATASDMSPNRQNPDPINFLLGRKGEGNAVDYFDVEFPTIFLTRPDLGDNDRLPSSGEGGEINTSGVAVREDKARMFRLTPESTSAVADNIRYDILIWSNCVVSFDLYYRVLDKSENPIAKSTKYPASIASGDGAITNYLLPGTTEEVADSHGWVYLGNSTEMDSDSNWSGRGRAVNMLFNSCNSTTIPRLNSLNENLRYEFTIMPVSYIGNSDIDTWSGTEPIEFHVNVAAGVNYNLIEKLGGRPSPSDWAEAQKIAAEDGLTANNAAQSIGRLSRTSTDDTLTLSIPNTDNRLPSFDGGTPSFPTLTTSSVTMLLNLTASGNANAISGDVYYAIGKAVGETGNIPSINTIRTTIASDYDEDGNLREDLIPATPGPDGEDRVYVTIDSYSPPPTDGGVTMPEWMMGGSDGDDPQKANTIQEPTADGVVNQRLTGGAVIAYGKVSPQTGVEFPVTLTNDDLLAGKQWEPDTDYFIYFVITRAGDKDVKSHIYVYQFRTPKAMLPRVTLTAETVSEGGETYRTGNVIMNINAVTEGYYRVITANEAEIVSILNQPFSRWTAHTGADEEDDEGNTVSGTDKTPDIYLTKNDGTPFTVLDALTESYSFERASAGDSDHTSGEYYYPNMYPDDPDENKRENGYWEYDVGYNVFDMYAGTEAKRQLYSFIETGALLSPESSSGINVSRPNGITAEAGNDMTNELPAGKTTADTTLEISVDDGSYLIFTYSIDPAMKDSKLSDNRPENTYQIAAFRALAFDKGKVGGPIPNSILGQITKTNGTYSGDVTITFDRTTYLSINSERVSMTAENLFSGSAGSVLPTSRVGITAIDGNTNSFSLNFSNVPSTAYLQFPGGYFMDGGGDYWNSILRIDIQTIDGREYMVVTWGSGTSAVVVGQLPITESAGRSVIITGGVTSQTDPAVTLNMSDTTSATVYANLSYTGDMDESSIQYRWYISDANGSDVVDLDKSTTTATDNANTITALKPGKAWITVEGYGQLKAGGSETVSTQIEVTVTGDVEVSEDTMTLVVGSTSSQSVTVTSGNETLASTALISYSVTSNNANMVTITVNDRNDTITVAPTSNATADSTVTIEVGLKASDGTDLTPKGTTTFTVTFKDPDPDVTYSLRPAATVAPSLTLTGSPTKLASGSSVGAKTNYAVNVNSSEETITATVTGVTGTVKWTLDEGGSSVVKLTGSGTSVTITGLAIGTTKLTATIGSLKKTVQITVVPVITLSAPTANSGPSITKNSDGTYNWSKTASGSSSVKLTFTSDIPLTQSVVSVTSTSDDSVGLHGAITLNSDKKGGWFQLDFKSMKASTVTVTFKAGNATKSVTFNLIGSDSGIFG